jgi:hypothetical protein
MKFRGPVAHPNRRQKSIVCPTGGLGPLEIGVSGFGLFEIGIDDGFD